ncbi:hypothetical protein D3C71_591700 [compost metagenome]
MAQGRGARIGAGLLGGTAVALALAIAVVCWYPDARGLHRLYAGIFWGVAAWIVAIFACLRLKPKGGAAPSMRRALHTAHSWAGAAFGTVLFIVCFSGAWAVVDENLRDWEARDHRAPAVPASDIDLDRMLHAASAQGMDWRNATLVLPYAWQRHVSISVNSRGRAAPTTQQPQKLLLDPAMGAVVQAPPGQMAGIVTTLHKSLHAGFPGRIVVSLFGVALTVLALSGIVLHARRWREALLLRTAHGLRVFTADAHKLIGFWLLPLLLLIGVTGIFSGLGALGTLTLSGFAYPGGMPQAMAELMGTPPARPAGTAAAMPSVQALFEHHRRMQPGFEAEMLTFAHWGDVNATFTVAGHRPGQLSTSVFERYHYRAADGALERADTVAGRGFWLQAFAAIQPLHFARYGGEPVKWLHFLGGLGAAVLAASGTAMWLQHRGLRGEAGRGAQVLHVLSLGLGGGLLVAAAMLMLATSAMPPTAGTAALQQPLFWGSWLFMLALPAWPACRRRGVQIVAALSGIGFGLAGLIDAGRGWREPLVATTPALAVDAVAIFLGLGLCVLAFRLQRKTT